MNPVDEKIGGLLEKYALKRLGLGSKKEPANMAEAIIELQGFFRRQILSVARRNTLKLPQLTSKLGVPVIVTRDFWQALKNSRRDEDENIRDGNSANP